MEGVEGPAAFGGEGVYPPYLFVDARYEKIRLGSRVVSQGVLLSFSAVREPEGLGEILAVEVADTESEATYQELFRSLKARGVCVTSSCS